MPGIAHLEHRYSNCNEEDIVRILRLLTTQH